MAISASLIGTLGGGGGAEVDSTPVSASGVGQSWHTMHTVTVPTDETWLIVCTGDGTGGHLSRPRLRAGNRQFITESDNTTEPLDVALVETGPATITIDLRQVGSFGTVSYTGTVYTIHLEV